MIIVSMILWCESNPYPKSFVRKLRGKVPLFDTKCQNDGNRTTICHQILYKWKHISDWNYFSSKKALWGWFILQNINVFLDEWHETRENCVQYDCISRTRV
jgi:hypothetical protein